MSIGLPARVGWFIMELPCSLVFLYRFFVVGGQQSSEPVPKFMAFVFVCHYAYRGYIYPLVMIKEHSAGSRNFDLSVAFGSWIVTCMHGYLSARVFAEHGRHLAPHLFCERKPRSKS